MKCQVKEGHLAQEATDVLVLGGYEDENALPRTHQAVDDALGGQLRELRETGRGFQARTNRPC